MSRHVLTVATAELTNHIRDRRSVLTSVLFALMGPAIVALVSFSPEASGEPGLLLRMMSVFTLVAAFTGGMNVAIDTAAGERERRSLVPLLLNPVDARDIVLGKCIAVAVLAVAAVLLNVAGLVATLAARVPQELAAHAPALLSWTLAGLIPLAILSAASELMVAMMCATAKEAHTCLTYVVFAPALIGMSLVFFPVGETWTTLPVIGQQLMLSQSLNGSPVSTGHALALAVVTIVSTVPPLAAATRFVRTGSALHG